MAKNTPQPGWFYSKYDDAWHPPEWFATPPTSGGYDAAVAGSGGAPTTTDSGAGGTGAVTGTINPAVLNALTLKYKRDTADLDDAASRYRINYNSALDKMRRSYDDTGLKNREGFADRGMLHSGARLGIDVKLRDEYNRQQAEAGTAHQMNLATVARRRLQAGEELNNNKILASLGLTVG